MLLWTLRCIYFCKWVFSFFSDKLRQFMELLDCMVALFSIFFLGYLYNILHSDSTNFPSHQQYMRVSLSPQPYQHLISVVLLKTLLLKTVRWSLTMVLMCISLIVRLSVPVGHLCVFFGRMPIQILCSFLN